MKPDHMTPTARNVLERILDDEDLEAPVSAGASSMRRENVKPNFTHKDLCLGCPECTNEDAEQTPKEQP